MTDLASRPRVLIIEDNEGVRAVVAELLGLNGYATAGAEDGAVGLAVAREWHPDVVLLDLMMPVMDGWAFREAQVADPLLRDIPVVVMTASYTSDVDVSRLGVLRVLRKPLDFDVLLAAIAAECGVAT